MGYIIKDTIIDLENKEKNLIVYTGKDGYVHEFQKYVEPYATEKGAFNKIQRDIDNGWISKRINEFESIENTRWYHKFEIIKVGA